MVLRVRWLCVACVLVLSSESLGSDVHHDVTTKQGALRGNVLTSRNGRTIYSFRGIPYAKPPLGELRFKPPQPADPWDGVRDASQDGPWCIQRNLYIRIMTIEGQEDCLYLNVYTNQLPDGSSSAGKAVMVWLHGGGWFAGTSHSSFYGPQHLLDKDIVLVTLNYRLGPFALLSTEDSVSPGNYGFKDQVQALKWVQQNIAAFGGNPDSVTIFGESAGGVSAHYHILSPMSKGLFHRAISQSGTALCSWCMDHNARQQAVKLAQVLGCPTSSSAALVDCLRKTDAEAIIATDVHFMEWDTDPMIPFRPVVERDPGNEEPFLPEDPLQILQQGKFQAVPWMTGITNGEGALRVSAIYDDHKLIRDVEEKFNEVVPIALFYGKTASDVDDVSRQLRSFYFGDQPVGNATYRKVVDMFTDAWFTVSADKSVKLHVTADRAPVYYYHITYRGSRSFSAVFGDKHRDYGVCHADDLLYLFYSNLLFPGTEPTKTDVEMIDIFTTLWTNFAKTGNPTPEKTDLIPVSWKPAAFNDLSHLEIGEKLRMDQNLLQDRVKFWESLRVDAKKQYFVREEL